MVSGPATTCASSSGGAQPPPDPYRLPSHYESGMLEHNYKFVKLFTSILYDH